MSTARFRFLNILFLLLVAQSLWASEDANHWLERMAQAIHQLNYDGVFIYSHDGHLQSMRIIHGVDERGERERLIALNGPSREVIRDREKVTCYLPDDHAVLEERVNPGRAFPFRLPERLEQIRQQYRIELAGEDRVAGMPAQMVAIVPRDNLRYGHNIWLNQDNGLLLRATTVDENGADIEQVMFTQIRFFTSLPEQLLEPQIAGEGMEWHRQNTEIDETVDRFAWRITRLPPGFELKTSRRHQMSARAAEVEHQVYSDGLTSISVFVELRQDDERGFIGHSRKGAVSAYARIADDRRITVVGEVPPATVELVAQSLHYPDGNND